MAVHLVSHCTVPASKSAAACSMSLQGIALHLKCPPEFEINQGLDLARERFMTIPLPYLAYGRVLPGGGQQHRCR